MFTLARLFHLRWVVDHRCDLLLQFAHLVLTLGLDIEWQFVTYVVAQPFVHFDYGANGVYHDEVVEQQQYDDHHHERYEYGCDRTVCVAAQSLGAGVERALDGSHDFCYLVCYAVIERGIFGVVPAAAVERYDALPGVAVEHRGEGLV